MKTTFTYKAFLITCFIFLNNLCHAQNIVWQKTIGGSNSDAASSVKPTSDGGFIIGGYSNSNISGDKTENSTNGSNDYWIVKLDVAGNIEWENTIGGDSTEQMGDIIETSDGGFLIGGSSSSDSSGDKTENGCNSYINYGDYWVIKINSSGVIEWQNTIGACASERLYSIDQTADGGYLLGGISSSNISCDKTEYNTAGINGVGYPGCGGGTSDYWIVKIDSTGNILGQKTLGRGTWASDFLSSVTATSDGGFICGGSSSAPNYVVPNYGGLDFWIVKLNSNYTVQWQKVIGGSGTEESGIVKQLADGNYIFGGASSSNTSGLKTESSYGLNDFWIFKLDTVGNIIWQKTIGGSGNDYLNYISPTFDNGFICGGYSNSPISGLKTSANFGQNDYWILKLDSVGNIQWQRNIGGSSDDVLRTISQMPNGNYFGGGYSNSDISGNKTENSKGGYDYWVFELDDASDYNLISGKTFYDYNGNNVKDSSDIYLPYKIIKETNTNRIAFSQADGTYRLSVPDTGTFTASQIQNLFYLSSTPSFHNATFTGMNQIDSLNDFATQQTIFINDLQISITPFGAFRPGFNATYNIRCKNLGTNPIQGTIIFYPDSGLTYVSSTVTPLSASTDSIVWQIPNLYPFNEANINVTVHVKSTAPIGYWVNSSVKIEPVNNDQNPSDNYASWSHFTTGSFDPNDILVDKDSITTTELLTSPNLDYVIRFQNTGSDTAFNVKILNPIDTSKLDLMSIEIISSSNIFNLNYLPLEGNLEFKFDNILLPDSNVNEPMSHGFIRYRIKPKTSLLANDSINNFAAIYFDANNPVLTNIATTKILLPNIYVSINPTVCDSFVSPSGNYTWTTSGIYLDTIPATANLDSVFTVLLTVNKTFSTINAGVCQSYISPSGNYTWTTPGTYLDTLTNAAGCDSIITINLSINNSNSIINQAACESFTSPSGSYLWTTSGIYFDTIPNAIGCDSTITFNLSVYNHSNSVINPVACNSYISPSGKFTWSASGTYLDTIPNITGCDSVITINLSVYNSSTATIIITECDNYISPSGNFTWTTTGTYLDTIANVAGCDSIITVQLAINKSHSSITVTACENYISPSGNYTWTTTGTYLDTLTNVVGCDSIITVQLSINKSYSTITVAACDNYTSPSGNYIWTTTGTYLDTLTNVVGCDSIITIQLAINKSYATITVTACESYISPSGNYIWTTTGIYLDTLTNVVGCDSIITIQLAINKSYSTINTVACESYISPSGNYTWIATGTYHDTITNVAGCDSIITIDLTVNTVDVTVTSNPPTLFANATGATYQWMYCDSVIISNETNQSFTATSNGLYAAIVFQNGCADTSACFPILNTGIYQNEQPYQLVVYPNPAQQTITISCSYLINNKSRLTISSPFGSVVYDSGEETSKKNEFQKIIDVSKFAAGIYFIQLDFGQQMFITMFVKK